MIQMREDIKIQYEKCVEMYFAEIENLKLKSIKAREHLLTHQFTPFPSNGSQIDKSAFILQYIPFIRDLVLFPDNEVIQKLKDNQFASHTLKWMVKLNDITIEIDRLAKIEGLIIIPNNYLSAIHNHLSYKLLINFIEDFELSKTYNNQDTNILFIDIDKRIRRRDYNKKMQQTPKMNSFERVMNEVFDLLENNTSDDPGFSDKYLRQVSKGNTSLIYTCLNGFYCQGISKNKVYLELFPLLKLIMKDVELFSFEEFISRKEERYDADYTKYQIARVKKILQKK
jgi:hypothetical protein